jgi:multicomponent Na+:H+ antiporter subunit D
VSGALVTALMALLVALPMVGALTTFVVPVRFRAGAGLIVSALTALCAGWVGWSVMTDGVQTHRLGGWAAPLGIELHVDGLTGVFLLMTAVVALPVGIYARTYFSQPEGRTAADELFWPLWLMLWGALNGIYLSADLFNLYVMIEVMSFAAVAMAVLTGQATALVAGLRYLLAALVGSMMYLMGVVLVYGAVGALDLYLAAQSIDGRLLFRVAFGLMLAGLMMKTALFPFHFWLPGAHSAARPPVSAILSALVVKATFYLIMRLWVDVFGGSISYATGQAVGTLGAAAILWGSYQALRQTRLKLMIAHSTVGQLGFLFLLFPLITVAHETAVDTAGLAHAWKGGIYQVLAHAFAKGALFLAAGVYVLAVGNDEKGSMVDLVARLPMTTFALGLAGVSLIGLPPSGGFMAKWMLLKAAFASGQWWWAPVILMGSLLTAGYVFSILRHAFAPSSTRVELRPVPKTLEVCALVLGLLAIVIGFRSEEILALLDVGVPFGEPIEPEEGA